jgi:hypothetical protein
MTARRSCREMKELAETDGVEWTMTHAYLANLGAFKFKVEGEPWVNNILGPPRNSRSTISLVSLERVYETIRERNSAMMPDRNGSQTRKDTETEEELKVIVHSGKDRSPSTHSSITGSQGANELEIDSIRGSQGTPPTSISSTVSDEGNDASSVNTGSTAHSRNTEIQDADELFDPYYIYPNATQLRAMREWGVIDHLPQISARDFAELGNTGALVKTVTFVQVSWFVLQIIARAAYHLPVSHLEITTLAFVICAILMYLLFRSIPRGIATSININLDRPIYGHDLNRCAFNLSSLGGYCGFELWFWPGESFCPDIRCPPPNDVVFEDGPKFTKDPNGVQQYCYGKLGIALAGTLFGVIHCIAWSFSFPTSAERIIWRTASLCIALFFVCWPIAFIQRLLIPCRGLGDKAWRVSWSVNLVANLIYAVARISLLVLVFRCLFFVPAEGFATTWADEIPHFS